MLAHRFEERLRRFVRCHHHNTRPGFGGVQLAKHLEPVHTWHPHIKEQKVEPLALERL